MAVTITAAGADTKTNESATMRTTEIGERGGKTIARMDSAGTLEEVDVVVVGRTLSVRKEQRSGKMLGERIPSSLGWVLIAELTIHVYSGVPIVEATQSPTNDDSSRAKREAATADALAKAKAMVEAENTKTTSDKAETKQVNGDAEANGKLDLEANTAAEDADVTTTGGAMEKAKSSSNTGKKRGREEVEAEAQEAGDLPEAKRVNTEVKEGDGKQSMES